MLKEIQIGGLENARISFEKVAVAADDFGIGSNWRWTLLVVARPGSSAIRSIKDADLLFSWLWQQPPC